MISFEYRGYDCFIKVQNSGEILLLDVLYEEEMALINEPSEHILPEILHKTYQENEGLLEILIQEGIVKDTGGREPSEENQPPYHVLEITSKELLQELEETKCAG